MRIDRCAVSGARQIVSPHVIWRLIVLNLHLGRENQFAVAVGALFDALIKHGRSRFDKIVIGAPFRHHGPRQQQQ